MVHLTEDQVSRYLEKRLTRMERVAISEHLATCEQCRTQVTRSAEFQRFATQGIVALTGVTRERKLSHLPFRRLTGTERLAIDMRTHLCPSVRANEPENGAIEPPRVARREWPGSWWQRISEGGTWGLATGAVAVLTALFLCVWFTRSQEDGVKLVTIRDANKVLRISAHGFIGTYLFESAESRQINRDLAQIVNNRKLTVPRAILALQDQPQQAHLNTPASDSLKLQYPVRTAVDTTTPLFQWTSRANATGYVVNVIVDDRNNRQVAKSSVIPASGNETSLYQWRLPANTPLGRGETYRWYVTALVNDKGGQSAAVDDPAAKFLVLSGAESENLAGLKTKADGSQLVAGLLELQAGLLDDAQRKFDDLRQKENQTDEGKAFLKSVIAEVKSMKGDH